MITNIFKTLGWAIVASLIGHTINFISEHAFHSDISFFAGWISGYSFLWFISSHIKFKYEL